MAGAKALGPGLGLPIRAQCCVRTRRWLPTNRLGLWRLDPTWRSDCTRIFLVSLRVLRKGASAGVLAPVTRPFAAPLFLRADGAVGGGRLLTGGPEDLGCGVAKGMRATKGRLHERDIFVSWFAS